MTVRKSCEYVHADADIFISRQISYYKEFPLKYRTEIPAGKKKKEMYFRFGHWYLGLYPALHTGQKRITEEIPLRITENFILPVWIGWTETTDYTVKEETYTPNCFKMALRSVKIILLLS